MQYKKTYAVIVAGGQGSRMGMALPKQFLPLHNKPILYYTIAAFIAAIPAIEIILVLPQAHISYTNMVLQEFETIPTLQIVCGGQTRYESVQNGLEQIEEQDSITFVHDGVRPLLSTQLIQACYEAALQYGSAIPCVPVVDSIRTVSDHNSEIVDRNKLRSIQTPQTFPSEILLKAFAQDYDEKFTDEASVVEAFGYPIHLIAGDRKNIKITTPEDLLIAGAYLSPITAADL
jgi:2-C-methyl-D-erythritol 4-phosphate cytidylyltransferase